MMRHGSIDLCMAALATAALVSCTGEEAVEVADPGTATTQKAPPSDTTGDETLGKHGTLDLIVDDIDEFDAELDRLLETFGGYVSSRRSGAIMPTETVPDTGGAREMTLTIKVEAGKFDRFLSGLKKLGSYVHEEVFIKDVTLAFMDMRARIANQQKMEQRLLGYLDDPEQGAATAIEAEKELALVRERIARLSTEFRVMENQIAYATLAMHAAERPPVVERSFWDDLGNAFHKVSIFGLAALPWVAVPVFILYFMFRSIRRKT